MHICSDRMLRVQTLWWVFLENVFSVGFWFKFFLTFCRIWTEKLSKLVSTCSENQLTKRIFSNFVMFSTHTRTSGENVSDFWQKKNSRKVVKLLLFAFREYTWMKNIFLKKSFWFDFRTSNETLSDYRQNFNR